MALRKCKECGNDVSTTAKSCPKCGAVQKTKTHGCVGCLGVLVIVAVVIFVLMLSIDTKPSSPKGIGSAAPDPKMVTPTAPENPAPEEEHSLAKPQTSAIVDPEQAVAEAKESLQKAHAAAMKKLEARADYQKAKEDLESARQRMVEASKTDGNPDLGAAMHDYAAASDAISAMNKEAANSVAVKAAEQRLAEALAAAPGTPEHVEYEVRKALGESNRNVARVFRVQIDSRVIQVYFSISDNLTEGWIKRRAKTDVVNILKAIQGSGYGYSQVTAVGTFSMKDTYGNSSEEMVLRATYKRSTVDRINWDGFLTDNIYSIADSVWLHPAFQ